MNSQDMAKLVVLASLNYSPAHVSHMEALLELFELIPGVRVQMLVDQAYLNDFKADGYDGVPCITNLGELSGIHPDLVICYNISPTNLSLSSACRKRNIPFLYVMHEPFPGLRNAMKEGSAFPKAMVAYTLNATIAARSFGVMLASEYAVGLYRHYLGGLNPNACYFPLVFLDRFNERSEMRRQFFSYIGTFTEAHGGPYFLEFVRFASNKDPSMRFLIATSTDITDLISESKINDLRNEGRLVVRQGRRMSNDEIDGYYRSSICTWNVYRRSTQSGVVVNAMMQGAVPICSDVGGMRDAIASGTGGYLLNSAPSYEAVLEAYREIETNLSERSAAARDTFLTRNWYGGQVDSMLKALGELGVNILEANNDNN